MKIEGDEFRGRQIALADAVAGAGFDGALVVSRGGSTLDRYGNVLYLTGHYQHYSYLPESPPTFSGRAHSAFAIAGDGRNVLCVAVPEVDDPAVFADTISHSDRWVETVRDALQGLGLDTGRVLLIGADVLPTEHWLALQELLPGVDWRFDDEPLETLRRIKSPAEQAMIRRSAAINREAVTAFFAAAVPGATEADGVAAAAQVIARHGAGLYYAAVSSGPKSWAYMSAPLPGWSTRRIERGDLVRLDLAASFGGYLSDFGRTVVAGGEPTPDQAWLVQAMHDGLDAAIGAVRPGGTVAEIVAAGDAALADAGVAMGGQAEQPGQIAASYPVHWGHCLGLGWERPWMIAPGDALIEPGMYLAIERALSLEGVGTVAAEQNLLVHVTGFELLTEGPEGRWS
ncbi:MAG: aminopeptidase P family protein [Rhodospirillaceae bacterium]|jgi:Xaa-Pro dipeptidase|nr:aminopeptidase P family protein [Rhodospirillaceae bacterium]MBT7646775.1 aminopeptidase P family protein [Rhodospirillaceae bacterium]